MGNGWMKVSRIIGNFGNERGRRTENKFFEAMRAPFAEEMFEWVSAVHRASAKEDRKGIDAVICTDVGKLFIQIKSSETGATEFRNGQHCRHRMIGVIIIRDHHTPEDIRKRAKSILMELRQNIISVRGNAEW